MARQPFTFMLRILRRDPDSVPMERLGEYITQFAALIGAENKPTFRGIKKASTGLKAYTPPERTPHGRARIKLAKAEPASKPARHLRTIEEMLGEDAIPEAQILDGDSNVIYVLFGQKDEDPNAERLYQEAFVDGIVTGLVGADATMHLHLRDHFDRDLKLNVRDEALAREILTRFRIGSVRLCVRGTWLRTENGWSPEASKCTVKSFEALDDTPLREIFAAAGKVRNNGWRDLTDPMGEWANIRGLH